ncbi:MAG TPA: PaaI family thioesterase [Thermoleophilia bacterium]|nr:PaaI family thioesterase [Thermoleophilia bacterium]
MDDTAESTVDRIRTIVENDRLIRHFGMTVDEASEGYARVSVEVREDFLNVHDTAHGALVFALADVAFAITVNSIVDAMGVQWSFNILRSARAGDVLTAECSIVHRGSRLLVVGYTVKKGDGVLVAQGQATALPVRNTAR